MVTQDGLDCTACAGTGRNLEASMTPREVRTAIGSQYWNLNYDQFCAILGLDKNHYAAIKWQVFRNLAALVADLGNFFDVLVEDYAAKAAKV